MKTAISLPDPIFEESTKRARELGISRSEFFATAARRYLDDLTRESVTRQIDQALELPGYDDDASAVAASAGRARLGGQRLVIERGAIHWVDLGEAHGSRPAKRRPVLVVQADAFNASRLNTTLAVVITSNTTNAAMPGNVFLPASATGLPRDSTVNVTALVTLNKSELTPDPVGHVPEYLLRDVDSGLRLVLDL